jgi:3-(3-hydroxy-phenyl)propionate hydroxylase
MVGLGDDPGPRLSATSRRRWTRAGGRIVHVAPRGRHASHEDLEGRLITGAAPHGWCLVVRPDRTVMHDGPLADADRLVKESLALLGCPAA